MENYQNSNKTDTLNEIASSLREIRNWIRVAGYPNIKLTLETILDTAEKRIVYDLSDGKRSAKEIANLSGVNIRYVSEWGQAWEALGILEQSQASNIKGRRQKIFEISHFGLQASENLIQHKEESLDEQVI